MNQLDITDMTKCFPQPHSCVIIQRSSARPKLQRSGHGGSDGGQKIACFSARLRGHRCCP